MVIPPLPLFLLSLPFYSSPFSFFLRFPSPLIPLEATCLSLAMASPGIQYGYRNGVGPPPNGGGVGLVTSESAAGHDTRCCFNVRSKADMSQLNIYRTVRPTSFAGQFITLSIHYS